MTRFDVLSKSALATLSVLTCAAIANADSVQVSKCITQKSNWPVIMGWNNGELVPKTIILEIYQANPASLPGGNKYTGFDPRMQFNIVLNDAADAGAYFPEEGFYNEGPISANERTVIPKAFRTPLQAKSTLGFLNYQAGSAGNPSKFKIVVQSQSAQNRATYFTAYLNCTNLISKN